MNSNLTDLRIKWSSARPYSPFVLDGELVYEDYLDSPHKLLFLMKESYVASDWWDIAGSPIETMQGGKVDTIWQNIHRWKFLINSFLSDGEVPAYPELEDLEGYSPASFPLSDIAYVNVSKELGESTSNAKFIQKRAIDDQEFLREQIDLLNPYVVICAGTFWCYHPIYNGNETISQVGERLYSHQGRTVIDFYHPGKPGGNRKTELYEKLGKVLVGTA